MSLKNLFLIERDKESLLSTCIIFRRVTKGQNFSERKIRTWFNQLVNKNDYDELEREEIIEFLFKETNM